MEKIFTWRQRWVVYSTNAMIVPVFALIGFGLDRWLGTKPWLLVIGTVGSFPLALAVTLYRLKKELKRNTP